MKNLALTNLMLLLAIKSVSACSYDIDPNNSVKVNTSDGFYDLILFISAFVLIIPIVILYFVRNRKGRWAIITSSVSLLLFIPAIFLTAFLFGPCGLGPVPFVIKAELFLMLTILIVQLFSWINQRQSSIKLQ